MCFQKLLLNFICAVVFYTGMLSVAAQDQPKISLTVTPQSPVLFVHKARGFEIRLQNDGNEPVGPVQVIVECSGMTSKRLSFAGPAFLSPREKWTHRIPLEPASAGRFSMKFSASAPPALLAETTFNISVSQALDVWHLPHRYYAFAIKTKQYLWIANENVGLAIVHNAGGYGPALLCVWEGGWKPMAAIPAFMEIKSAESPPVDTNIWPRYAFVRRGTGKRAIIKLVGRCSSGGVKGMAKVELRLNAGNPDIEVETSFVPTEEGRLARFTGPLLLAGDGTFGSALDQGLFPGIEWLESGEKSSSELDITTPAHFRSAPHPNRVTLPLMAIGAPHGGVVGISWNPLHKWDETHDRPVPLFASPNFLQNQDNHLMGLFLPSIPQWVEEHQLSATKPYELHPGKALTIRQRIFAMPKGSIREAIRLWFKRYDTPPLPELPRSYKDTIALSLRGFEELLYVDGKGWQQMLGKQPVKEPRYALYYLLAAQALGSNAPYDKVEQNALKRIGEVRDLALAAHVGGSIEPLIALREEAYRIMAAQDSIGGWYFCPDKEHLPLGKPGDTSLGIVAVNAATVLKAARLFQDSKLLAAGLKGLAFMKRFQAPRGAQVWEVPLHAPDILAASYGVEACLDGYLATGDVQHLRRAAYWAEAGLPFLYTWQAPEKNLAAMLYSSIPVFGASWFQYSWFGVSVQWNGLAFAASLQRLSAYDKSYKWPTIAEGITRSAIIQQQTEKACIGLYPDSVNMLDGAISRDYMLAPALILDNVFPLIGRNVDPHIETLRLKGQAIMLIAAGKTGNVQTNLDRISFSLQYPAGDWRYVTLVGVTEPAQIVSSGLTLARVEQFTREQGYRYEPKFGILEIKLRRTSVPAMININGIKALGSQESGENSN